MERILEYQQLCPCLEDNEHLECLIKHLGRNLLVTDVHAIPMTMEVYRLTIHHLCFNDVKVPLKCQS